MRQILASLIAGALLAACSCNGHREEDAGVDADAEIDGMDGVEEDVTAEDLDALEDPVPDTAGDEGDAPDAAEDAMDDEPDADDPAEEDGPGDVVDAVEVVDVVDVADAPDVGLCGNGAIDTGEECDGTLLGSADCLSLGHYGGTLACTPSCTYDESGCIVSTCVGMPDFTRCVVTTTPDRDYDICIAGGCLSPGCGNLLCNPPGPHFALADTNVRDCYDATASIGCPGAAGTVTCGLTPYCGQDAQYGWDASFPSTARFSRTEPVAGEPVVRDIVTGLDWVGCIDGLSESDCGSGTAVTRTWDDALAACEALSWGLQTDWRLPDPFELMSIVDFGRYGPAVDATAFPATPTGAFWTNATLADYTDTYAYTVEMNQGLMFGSPKTSSVNLRCVRGVPTPGGSRYTRVEVVTGEPVMQDNWTGLEWQGCAAGLTGSSCTGTYATRNWLNALVYCELLSYGGHTDWYLPNIKEIQSLKDPRRYPPGIDPFDFPNMPAVLWSSTTLAGSASMALRSSNLTYYDDMKSVGANGVICVRDP